MLTFSKTIDLSESTLLTWKYHGGLIILFEVLWDNNLKKYCIRLKTHKKEIFPFIKRNNSVYLKQTFAYMSIATLDKRQQKILEEIPTLNDFSKIYFYTVQSKFDNDFVKTLDSMIGLNDTILSDWLSITPRTFRNYKKNTDLILKGNIKEHIVLIISLYKHGIEVFGDTDNFEKWLSMKNPLLDNQAPTSFLDTVSGIKFIDNRLSALEYGENV